MWSSSVAASLRQSGGGGPGQDGSLDTADRELLEAVKPPPAVGDFADVAATLKEHESELQVASHGLTAARCTYSHGESQRGQLRV